jgi:hypothetical protein
MEFSRDELMDLVAGFTSKLESYKKEVDDLKSYINDEFVGPAAENYKRLDHDNRLEDFRKKYSKDFEPLLEGIKKEEGEDFDVFDKVFSDYDSNENPDKPEEAEYVASVVASLTEQLEQLKEATGAENIEVKTNENGETEVKADGENVATAETIEEPKEDDSSEEDDDEVEKEIKDGLAKFNDRIRI